VFKRLKTRPRSGSGCSILEVLKELTCLARAMIEVNWKLESSLSLCVGYDG